MTIARHSRVVARRPAFTLLELILGMVLMTTLLAATWSLLGIFRNRVEKAQLQTEQRHLIRALQRTLESDLQHMQLAPLRPATSPSDELSAEQRSALDSLAAESTAKDPPSGDGDVSDVTPSVPAVPADEPPLQTQFAAPVEDVNRAEPRADERADDATPPGDASESDALVRDALRAPETVLVGTSDALVLDVIQPAVPGGISPPTEPPNLETAAIPDTVRRVVYLFVDPSQASLTARPAGLVRCEFDARSRVALELSFAGAGDLFEVLRPALEEQGATFTLVEHADSNTTPAGSSAQSDNPLEQLNTLGTAPILGLPDLSQQVDYAPEVAAFLLRYYDGAAWHMSWDSRQQSGRFPVAVELRFRLVAELSHVTTGDPEGDPNLPADPGSAGGLSSAGGPSGMAGETPQAQLLASLTSSATLSAEDSALHSSQTEPLEDHRYLIFLHPAADSESAMGGSEETEGRAEDSADGRVNEYSPRRDRAATAVEGRPS